MATNTALNCDCMEYMRSLPDKAFDLAVVDPPYGDALASESGGGYLEQLWGEVRQVQAKRGMWHGKQKYHGETKKSIAWDVAPKQEYFDELFRISRNQIIWGGNYFDLKPTRCFIIWRKTNIPLEGFSMSPVEYAWTSFQENASCFDGTSTRTETSGKFHPTEKPIALYDWIYAHYAHDGDRILDTHLGSGSSRIAAYDAGLDFVGCEIDKTYFDLQEERFAAHTAQQSLFVGS